MSHATTQMPGFATTGKVDDPENLRAQRARTRLNLILRGHAIAEERCNPVQVFAVAIVAMI